MTYSGNYEADREAMKQEDNLAVFEACWAGDFVYVCEKHLRKLIAIGNAMAAPVNYHIYEGLEKCKNCENET